jgi:hypothetical protein
MPSLESPPRQAGNSGKICKTARGAGRFSWVLDDFTKIVYK